MNKLISAILGILFLTNSWLLQSGFAQRDAIPFQIIDKNELPKLIVAEEEIRKILWKQTDINLKDKTLRELASSITNEFKIKCKIDLVALDEEAFPFEQKFTWREQNATLGKSLNEILGTIGLTYAIKDDALFLTTIAGAEAHQSTRMYEVSDILASGQAQRAEVIRRGITSSSFDFQQLIELLESVCTPESWDYVGGAGSTRAVELNGKQLLLVSQIEQTHMEITEFLEKLRDAAGIKKDPDDKELDLKKPVLRVYPLGQDLKSSADDYAVLIKTVIKQDWDAEGISINAIANTLVVKQTPEIHGRILGMLTDLDALLRPQPIQDERNGNGLGGGFFNIESLNPKTPSTH